MVALKLRCVPSSEVSLPLYKKIDRGDINSFSFFLFIFQECFIAKIHTVYLLKPDGFWERSRVSFGSSKLLFEVLKFYYLNNVILWNISTCTVYIELPQGKKIK